MLIKINNKWCVTRLTAYKRYKYVIKPLNDLISYMDNEKAKDLKEYKQMLKNI